MKFNTRLIELFNVLVVTTVISSCDPDHFGKTFIRNESSHSLELKFEAHLEDTTIIIQPNSVVDVFHFGGLGSGQDYDCCSCEFTTISLQPTEANKKLTKNITEGNTWTMTNNNDKRFSGKEITCEFVIFESDIQ